MTPHPRVVFDCNTFLQALASPDGPAGACFTLAATTRCHLFVSPIVLAELREVTARPKLIAKLKLNPTQVDEFIQSILVVATLIDHVHESFTYTRDPDDAHYVNLALAVSHNLIVSRGKDLLDLMSSTTPEAQTLMHTHPDFRVLTPPQFLTLIEST